MPKRTRKQQRSQLSPVFKKNLLIIGSFTLVGVVFSFGSILYAKNSGGQINVSAVISASNQTYAEQASVDGGAQVPRPNPNSTPRKPNGGLIGTGKSTPPPPPPEPASTTTATSSETATASSTPDDSGTNTENEDGAREGASETGGVEETGVSSSDEIEEDVTADAAAPSDPNAEGADQTAEPATSE